MSKPTAVGAYIFAGGFTHGVLEAGFDVLAQLEEGEYGVATSKINHPSVPVYTSRTGGPGYAWPTEALIDRGVDLVYANPPCAPFSNAARSRAGTPTDRWKNDPRVACIRNAFSLLASLRPRVWVWESVQAVMTNGQGLIDELSADAAMLGYQTTCVLFENARLGVPQYRRRCFVVFHDVLLGWAYPHDSPLITVRDAFAPITSGALLDGSPPPPRPRQGEKALRDYLSLLDGTPPGGALYKEWNRRNPDESLWERNARGGVIGRPRFLDKRLAWDEPAKTMTGGATKFHPEKPRYITVLEQQLLCGYPPEYRFIGPLNSMYAQTAQAVMPPTGRWLAETARRGIELGTREKCRSPYIVNLDQARVSVRRPPRSDKPMDVTKEPMAEPRIPEGDFVGPTALARAMMAADPQVEDGEILMATRALFGPQVGNPKLFTRADLGRLRERIARKAAK